MRRTAFAGASLLCFALIGAAGCSADDLAKALTGGDGTADAAPATADAAVPTDATVTAVVGKGCGYIDGNPTQLCAVTSQCPTVIIDTDAFPSCGFRIRGSVVDLVCICSDLVCAMGTYSTCAEATSLLGAANQGTVCNQVNDGLCGSGSAAPATTSTATTPASTSTCDKDCMHDCGGGSGCASVCGC